MRTPTDEEDSAAEPSSAAAPAGGLGTVRRQVVLALLCSAFLIDVMGASSVFTASPSIERALHLSPAGLQWTFTAATLPAGALLLPGGRLADLFGPRRMFLTGLSLMLGASLACGLAPDAAVLVAARAGQGAASAIFIPAALSLVIRTFDGDVEQRRALAVWSAVGGIGSTAGLLLGGGVTAGIGWRWVFLINVPVIAVVLAAFPSVPAAPALRDQSRKSDAAGTLSFGVGMALVIYAISQVSALGWRDWRTCGLGLAGIAVLGAFVRIEIRSASPIIPSWLVRSRTLVAGNATMLVTGMFVDGTLFILTLLTQRVWGYSALQFGGAAAVMTVTSVAAAWVAQRMIAKVGTRPVTAAGLALLGLAGAIFAVTATANHATALLITGMVLFGAGMGGAFVAGSVASLRGVADENSGVASAVQNISFTMGSVLGVAILSTIAAATTGHRLPYSGASVAAALSSGYRAALIAGAAVAVIGLVATTVITGASRARSAS
jgi:MFS family permease